MFSISAPDRSHIEQIQHKINNKTKPLGALGQLETLACQIALIQQSEQLTITQPHLVIFAGDHGITKHGVSIAPSDVTGQMVANFLAGEQLLTVFVVVIIWISRLSMLELNMNQRLTPPDKTTIRGRYS